MVCDFVCVCMQNIYLNTEEMHIHVQCPCVSERFQVNLCKDLNKIPLFSVVFYFAMMTLSYYCGNKRENISCAPPQIFHLT